MPAHSFHMVSDGAGPSGTFPWPALKAIDRRVLHPVRAEVRPIHWGILGKGVGGGIISRSDFLSQFRHLDSPPDPRIPTLDYEPPFLATATARTAV